MADSLNPRLSQAATDLGLPYDGSHQDWGIESADPERLPEFVAYYRDHQAEFDEWAQEYYLGELLLQSANDALHGSSQPYALIETALFLVIARREHEATQFLLNYWVRLDRSPFVEGKTEFPIAAVLRRAFGS
ncbi:hypothetical protein V3W47_07335 [Deinococcus sp. YIM 134068]|uniref:hypothetical protein n=1 Tax=Deinococcus lichenicola TaxID=3118910 RepID=UPI002F93208B